MELMNSAFLCVLVVLLPQTLGKSRNKNSLKVDEELYNKTVVIQKPTFRKKLLLNINGPPLVTNIIELQTVFNNFTCRSNIRKTNRRPSSEELRHDILTNEIGYRKKRETIVKQDYDKSTEVTPKKTRAKKNKLQKTITVTKYNVGGEVYALKVKETHISMEEQDDSKVPTTTCQVYSVKKSFSCESPEGEALLSSARRKANKKKAKKENTKTSSTTEKSHTSVFKKREVDNSQVVENFMTSIEDIY